MKGSTLPQVVLVSEEGRVVSATIDGRPVSPEEALGAMFERAAGYVPGPGRAVSEPEPVATTPQRSRSRRWQR